MVTINKVADKAGVSVSTVSHVLNRTRFVAPETAERVMQAVRELDYAPNGVARSLKLRHTRTLGMIVPSNANPFFAELMNGVERACFDRQYSLIVCNSDDRLDKVLHHVSMLRGRRIEGLLAVLSHISAATEQTFLSACATLPTMLLDGHGGEGLPVYTDDSVMGGYLATRHLIDSGCMHIACIGGRQNHVRTRERVNGFEKAIREREDACESVVHYCSDMRVSDGALAMQELLNASRKIDGIFCCNDLLAIGALSTIRKAGLSVPEDISVVGYDDIEIAAYTIPALTTIRQSVGEIGQKAASIMIGHLQLGEQLPKIIHHQPQLVSRDSVRRKAVSHSTIVRFEKNVR